MRNPTINYTEATGPFVRVGVLISNATPDEERAQDEAMSHLATDELPAMVDAYEWGWEFAFEAGYLR